LKPIVSVVGKSNSGKTTLLEKLITEMTARGHNVCTIKHDAHSFNIDHEGKDSWRHFQAGARATLISSPEKFAMVRRVDKEWGLPELVAQMGDDADIFLTEGYKGAASPKIEVVRGERSSEPICSPDQLIALVTDLDLDLGVPRFDINDYNGICDLLERDFLGGGDS